MRSLDDVLDASTVARPTVPLALGGPEDDVRVGKTGGERREPEPEGRARRSDRDALQRLVALGVTPTAAQELVEEHGMPMGWMARG
jgi:hypothetical protein